MKVCIVWVCLDLVACIIEQLQCFSLTCTKMYIQDMLYTTHVSCLPQHVDTRREPGAIAMLRARWRVMINLRRTAIPPANRTGRSRRNARPRELNQPKVTIVATTQPPVYPKIEIAISRAEKEIIGIFGASRHVISARKWTPCSWHVTACKGCKSDYSTSDRKYALKSCSLIWNNIRYILI